MQWGNKPLHEPRLTKWFWKCHLLYVSAPYARLSGAMWAPLKQWDLLSKRDPTPRSEPSRSPSRGGLSACRDSKVMPNMSFKERGLITVIFPVFTWFKYFIFIHDWLKILWSNYTSRDQCSPRLTNISRIDKAVATPGSSGQFASG